MGADRKRDRFRHYQRAAWRPRRVAVNAPLDKRLWKALHHVANRLAHRYGPSHHRIGRDDHWLWKLNNWLGDRWIPWWIDEVRRRS